MIKAFKSIAVWADFLCGSGNWFSSGWYILLEVGIATHYVFHRYEGVNFVLQFALCCTCDYRKGHPLVSCLLPNHLGFLCLLVLRFLFEGGHAVHFLHLFSDLTLKGVRNGLLSLYFIKANLQY